MQAVTIHKATAQDTPQIAAMARELAAFEGEKTLANEAVIARVLSKDGTAPTPHCECFIAKDGHEAAGFVLYYAGYDLASDSAGFHVADMFVCEVYRRRGVGAKLLAALANEAQEQSRQWLSLTALHGNIAAKDFYVARGFTAVDVQFYAIGKNGLNTLAKHAL